MKNIILIITYMMIGTLTLASILSLSERQNRKTELQGSLPGIVEESVENVMSQNSYTILDRNEFVADVVENLADLLDTSSDIMIEIINADEEKGLLSIRVTETFQYLNGKTGSASCDRTVIFEQTGTGQAENCSLAYYINAGDVVPYKKYDLLKGDNVVIPKEPARKGYIFEGWKDGSGNAPSTDQTMDSGKEFYAKWMEAPEEPGE